MKSTKYYKVDKSIIEVGGSYEFNLFIASDTKKEIYPFKESGKPITYKEKRIVDTKDVLYVKDTEYIAYEHFKNTKQYISFEERSEVVYKNTAKILDDLFKNPEKLGNYEASKKAVGSGVVIT